MNTHNHNGDDENDEDDVAWIAAKLQMNGIKFAGVELPLPHDLHIHQTNTLIWSSTRKKCVLPAVSVSGRAQVRRAYPSAFVGLVWFSLYFFLLFRYRSVDFSGRKQWNGHSQQHRINILLFNKPPSVNYFTARAQKRIEIITNYSL